MSAAPAPWIAGARNWRPEGAGTTRWPFTQGLSSRQRSVLIVLLSVTVPVSRELWIGGKEMNLALSDPILVFAAFLLAGLLLAGRIMLPLAALGAAAIALNCLSFFVNIDMTLAGKGPLAAFVEMAKLATLWVHFWVVANLIETRQDLLLLLKSWILASSAVGLTGIYGSLAYQHLGWQTAFNQWFRANGTFDNSNLFALHMCASFMFTLIYRNLSGNRAKWTVVVAAVQAAGVFYSASRSAFMALICGLLLYWLLGATVKERLLSLALAALSLSSLVFLPNAEKMLQENPITARFATTTVSMEAREADDRKYLWLRAIEGFGSAPILGIGRGNFMYLNRDDPTRMGHTHNTYLGILCEMGLAGLALYLILIGWLILRILPFWFWGGNQAAFNTAGALLTTFAVLALFGLTHSIENYRGLWIFFAITEGFSRLWSPSQSPVEAA